MKTNYVFIYSNFDFSRKSAGSTRMKYYARAIANDYCKVYLVSCSSTEINDQNFIEFEPKDHYNKGFFFWSDK